MKKLKIVAITSGILTFLQLIPIGIAIIAQIKFRLTEASAIGIIGGADGPTAIYVTDSINPMLPIIARYVLFATCVLTFIVSIVVIVKNKNR